MNIDVYNPRPTYAIADRVIEDDCAKEFVKRINSAGKPSKYSGNAHTLEHKIDSHSAKGVALGVADCFTDVLIAMDISEAIETLKPHIETILRDSALGKITGYRGLWGMRYGPGGEFTEHVDWSLDQDEESTPAIATMCIALPGAYTGGELYIGTELVSIPMCGAAIWSGWTYHKVSPVISGHRYICAIHFTGLLKT